MIKGFAHLAIYTNCFDDTLTFYENALEAENLGCFYTDKRGAWLKMGNFILEVFESEAMPEGSFKHVALFCDNVEDSMEKAVKYGATVHMQPKDIVLDLKEKKALHIAFIKGINGEQIELCQER